MNAELLAAMAGILLSLAAMYVPKFDVWFGALEPNQKRLFMLGMTALAGVAIFGLNCAGLGEAVGMGVVSCDGAGAMVILQAFVVAMVANQATFLAAPRVKRNATV